MTATVVRAKPSNPAKERKPPAPDRSSAAASLPPVSAGLVDALFIAEKGQRSEARSFRKAA